MVRIEVSHSFPVSVAEAFTYITDIKNWPEYWPDFVRIDNPSTASWSSPGDKATVVINLLNRERALKMELKEFQKNTRVIYLSRQQGLPDVRHERHFKTAPDGCEYLLVVEYKPRRGLTGLFDRFLVKRSVERAMQKTVQNLELVFQPRRNETSA
jgi:polyketide cyclase/dehydrase/lipid transport protein